MDYVLHHYTPDMLDVCYTLFGNRDISVSECDKRSHDGPFSYAKKEIPLTEDQVDQAVYIVDRDRARWLPTLWGRLLAEALIDRMDNHGDEVRVITARSTWRHAGRVVMEIFGREVPLFTCESAHKHLIIENHSIYFEDSPSIINNTLHAHDNMIVLYPLWAWNRGKVDEDISDRAIPITMDMWPRISLIIESEIRKIKNGNKR